MKAYALKGGGRQMNFGNAMEQISRRRAVNQHRSSPFFLEKNGFHEIARVTVSGDLL